MKKYAIRNSNSRSVLGAKCSATRIHIEKAKLEVVTRIGRQRTVDQAALIGELGRLRRNDVRAGQ